LVREGHNTTLLSVLYYVVSSLYSEPDKSCSVYRILKYLSFLSIKFQTRCTYKSVTVFQKTKIYHIFINSYQDRHELPRLAHSTYLIVFLYVKYIREHSSTLKTEVIEYIYYQPSKNILHVTYYFHVLLLVKWPIVLNIPRVNVVQIFFCTVLTKPLCKAEH